MCRGMLLWREHREQNSYRKVGSVVPMVYYVIAFGLGCRVVLQDCSSQAAISSGACTSRGQQRETDGQRRRVKIVAGNSGEILEAALMAPTAEFWKARAVPRTDPLALERVTPFVRRPVKHDQLPPDYRALLSLAFGVAGLMLKSTWASWASVFCCMSSLGNVKAKEADPKQIVCSVLFASMGLLMNYFGPARGRPIL